VGAGNDEILGGVGADTITVGNGSSVIFGDGGSLAFTNGKLTSAQSLDTAYGGNDLITLGTGNNIVELNNDGSFQGQMAVYVKPRGSLGKAYMALIKPFRHLIVYPALMRQIAQAWDVRSQRGQAPAAAQ